MADKTGNQAEVPTTGHEWDGIQELNTPLPKWWLYTFYACTLWAVVYWVLMPSWPLVSSYTKGIRNHSQREVVAENVAAMHALRMQHGAALADAELQAIEDSPDMLTFALANGKAAFGDNCAPCHGTGAEGGRGYPNLNDDDWLWGGTLDDIHTTLLHGANWDADEETRFGGMTAFGTDGILEHGDIVTVANYVRSLSGLETEPGADLEAGKVIFEENCVACHGDDAKGMHETGAPNLTDSIWLYGSNLDTIVQTITNGRKGAMPAWVDRLDPVTVKSLAVYVHSLGGGQ